MPSTLLYLPCEAPGAGQALCSLPQKCSRTHGGLVSTFSLDSHHLSAVIVGPEPRALSLWAGQGLLRWP